MLFPPYRGRINTHIHAQNFACPPHTFFPFFPHLLHQSKINTRREVKLEQKQVKRFRSVLLLCVLCCNMCVYVCSVWNKRASEKNNNIHSDSSVVQFIDAISVKMCAHTLQQSKWKRTITQYCEKLCRFKFVPYWHFDQIKFENYCAYVCVCVEVCIR